MANIIIIISVLRRFYFNIALCLYCGCVFQQVPQYSTLMFAGFSTLVAMFFNTDTTVDMLSIGTLTAYMMVTCGLISNRFTGTVVLICPTIYLAQIIRCCLHILPKHQ